MHLHEQELVSNTNFVNACPKYNCDEINVCKDIKPADLSEV